MTYVPAHELPTSVPGRHRTGTVPHALSADQDTIGPTSWHKSILRRWKPLATVLSVGIVSGIVGASAVLTVDSFANRHADDNKSVVLADPLDAFVERAAAKAVPSVVKLATEAVHVSEEGSGIILTGDGLILTNRHVVSYGEKFGVGLVKRVATFADGRIAPFTVIGADPVSDVAVVQAQGISGLRAIAFGSAANLRVGEKVVAVGSPLGLDSTVTVGIISALHRPIRTVADPDGHEAVLDAVQTDAAINRGSSGGALIDMNGSLIGVNSVIATTGRNSIFEAAGWVGLGFAIPIDHAKRIADELIATGTASHPYLGLQLADDSSGPGARIIETRSGSPAAAVGLAPDMVITMMDGRVIVSADALVAAILSKAPGDTAVVTAIDPAGATHTVPVVLASDQDRR